MNFPLRQLAEDEFPELLKEIPDPPKKLYVRGTLPNPEMKLLCIVGSRKYTPYGKEVCEKLVQEITGYNIAIISGLALGIDAIAHKAALNAGIHTIAIPGSGLNDDILYPSSHRILARNILEAGGALLSEFEPDFKAAPFAFPQRNRIMAGLSHATLIIEAEEKSGTLITARLATDYNRDVLIVPNSIFSRTSSGPHMLLRLGAIPITKSDDILEALHLEKEVVADVEDYNVSEDEKNILRRLPMTRDELIREMGLPASETNILLSAMELKGLIKESLGEIRINK